jgi:hypothetical protein
MLFDFFGCRKKAVIGMAHSTNGLVTSMQVPVDEVFKVK